LLGDNAYYKLRPGDKVKNLPADARCAFTALPGGRPSVKFEAGAFWSLRWRDWDCEKIRREVGDYLVEDGQYGIEIVPAASVVPPD